MFKKDVYIDRRKRLVSKMSGGIALFPGHTDAHMNYLSNIYHFRQNSSFLYYFGLDFPDIGAAIDLDSGESVVFGNELTMDDIIWMGPQPSMRERCAEVGVTDTRPFNDMHSFVKKAQDSGRKIHFLPQYRGETKILMSSMLGVKAADVNEHKSLELVN